MNDARNTAHRVEATAALEIAQDHLGDCRGNTAADALPDDYDERPIESTLELEELVRLRAELTWGDWKAHPRFKKDRVIREAQRRMGVPAGDAPVVLSPAVVPANDVAREVTMADTDAELAQDGEFATLCDERRDAWMQALDTDNDAQKD